MTYRGWAWQEGATPVRWAESPGRASLAAVARPPAAWDDPALHRSARFRGTVRVARYNYEAQFEGGIDELVATIRAVLLRGEYVPSPEGAQFEAAFARFVGSRFAVGVGCGTDALILSLRALGIGPGDEVVTQANSFYATAAAIAVAGATPVLVDADEESFLIDQAQVRAALTARTRAIIPVHLYGKPTPMLELLRLAAEQGLAVVEDAAQAHGAVIHGRGVGSFGAAGCFSFHPSKNLAAASNGGCVTTDDEGLRRSLDAHRTHGQLVQHEHVVLGVNSKLDAIQSAILLAKLRHLRDWNERRRRIARFYREQLADLELRFQRDDPDELHVYHLFQVRLEARDRLLDHLQHAGVDATVRYPHPIHLQPPFARYGWRRGAYPVAEALADQLLCLPIRPDMSLAEATHVTTAVRAFYGRKAA